MFTGIVETTGTVIASQPVAGGRRLTVDAGIVADDAINGASISVNGVCLTVTQKKGTQLVFDVISETLNRSNLGKLNTGDKVNLERSLRSDSRLDGHFVQGHVDGTADVVRKIASDREWVLWLRADAASRRYIVPKGSIAIDGISLTIAEVRGDEFSVAIIPTTLERTNLGARKPGDRVNLESDVIVRTVVHTIERLAGGGGVTLDHLREHGFL